jgi:acetyl esterase/lipase
MGFSAGGHLAARTSTTDNRNYAAVDMADRQSLRPDFTVLIYPAYIGDKEYKISSDIRVTSSTPPAYVVQTQDEKNHVFSSITYKIAMHKAGVPAELHLFPTGGHGYGLRPSKNEVSHWPVLCEAWLKHFTAREYSAPAK